MKLPKELTTVTPLSKFIALLIYTLAPVIAFYLGLNYQTSIGIQPNPGRFMFLICIVVVWEIIWKGIGMYQSAQRKNKFWFVLILVTNSIGILPLIYLLFFAKIKK